MLFHENFKIGIFILWKAELHPDSGIAPATHSNMTHLENNSAKSSVTMFSLIPRNYRTGHDKQLLALVTQHAKSEWLISHRVLESFAFHFSKNVPNVLTSVERFQVKLSIIREIESKNSNRNFGCSNEIINDSDWNSKPTKMVTLQRISLLRGKQSLILNAVFIWIEHRAFAVQYFSLTLHKVFCEME